MNLTLLLDLDDTLLDLNMEDFIPVYFQALSSFLKEYVPPDKMISALMAGTGKMMANNDPSRTLQQVFDAEFFPLLGLVREELQPVIDRFYEEVFPTLHYLTRPRPDAITLVKWAFSHGISIAVATNPLFPLAAIHHRMRWAGLPPDEFPFEVISSYETFHFSKPNPAYFAEILGYMGWPDNPVLMVGDDPDLDFPGCKVLGLPFYWINPADDMIPDGIEFAGHGSIADLHRWLEGIQGSLPDPDFSTREALTALLLAAPATILGLLSPIFNKKNTDGLELTQRPTPNEWSITELICHLRDTELEVNLPRLRMLLVQDEPFLPARTTDTWAKERKYNNQNSEQALRDLITARIQTVELLSGLKEEWKRKARHAIFGPTDLQELVKFIAEHDKLHIRQLKATLEMLSI